MKPTRRKDGKYEIATMCRCPICNKIFPFTFVDDKPGSCLSQVNSSGPTELLCGILNCETSRKETFVKIDEKRKAKS